MRTTAWRRLRSASIRPTSTQLAVFVQETFLTVQEIAELLKVNTQTVYNWIDGGTLRAIRI
jgi:hypothetical protein